MSSIIIAQLYPDELNLYGDTGNVLCLQYRLRRRGFGCTLRRIESGDALEPFDILVIGGGQDREMALLEHDVQRKAAALRHTVESGKTVFAVCAGFQILGDYYLNGVNKKMHLSGALDFYTEAGAERFIGNMVFDSPFGKVVGFENHSGRTYLSSSLTPLGHMLRGYGNNGTDGTEGVLYKNTFGTYAHGPVLPKNPLLADEIIQRAVGSALAPLDDVEELRCHNALIKRFLSQSNRAP